MPPDVTSCAQNPYSAPAAYPARFRSWLLTHFPPAPHRFKNAAIPASTSTMFAACMETLVPAASAPPASLHLRLPLRPRTCAHTVERLACVEAPHTVERVACAHSVERRSCAHTVEPWMVRGTQVPGHPHPSRSRGRQLPHQLRCDLADHGPRPASPLCRMPPWSFWSSVSTTGVGWSWATLLACPTSSSYASCWPCPPGLPLCSSTAGGAVVPLPACGPLSCCAACTAFIPALQLHWSRQPMPACLPAAPGAPTTLVNPVPATPLALTAAATRRRPSPTHSRKRTPRGITR